MFLAFLNKSEMNFRQYTGFQTLIHQIPYGSGLFDENKAIHYTKIEKLTYSEKRTSFSFNSELKHSVSNAFAIFLTQIKCDKRTSAKTIQTDTGIACFYFLKLR
ncbi:MAG TPA: hypothetical protein DDW18_02130 [Firmicutes bacterium]|nr:hypothetical protein [Bacillota bacterium]HBN00954.1 hypothetical protein [Bacillota bacterium]